MKYDSIAGSWLERRRVIVAWRVSSRCSQKIGLVKVKLSRVLSVELGVTRNVLLIVKLVGKISVVETTGVECYMFRLINGQPFILMITFVLIFGTSCSDN